MTAIATFDSAFVHAAALIASMLAGCAVVVSVVAASVKPKPIPVRVKRQGR